MDVLSNAVAAMRSGLPHSSRQALSGTWRLDAPAFNGAGFHVVLQGACTVRAEGGEPIGLAAGDVALLPHGTPHELRSISTSRAGDGTPTVLLCGAYTLDRTRPHPLLSELPGLVHLPARVGRHPWLRSAIDLLGAELEEARLGGDAVVAALLETLLLYMLRAWYMDRSQEPAAAGWALALEDAGTSTALRRIHEQPERPWTVESLAAEAGLSRAAFARRFASFVGQPPLAYLTWWRMTMAARLLCDSDLPLRVVAERAGYTSEFAFARAFKRELGTAPGMYRRMQQRA